MIFLLIVDFLCLISFVGIMKPSIIDLTETIIVLSNDDQLEVEKVANESIVKLHEIFNTQNKKSLIELLEESFYSSLIRLPLSIRTSSK